VIAPATKCLTNIDLWWHASRAVVVGCVGLLLIVGVTSAQQAPIKLGLLLTYQGPTAIFARYEDKGARLAIEEANKAGGIQGQTIEIVNYDTEGNADRAGVLYRRLAEEDKVVAVIGPDGILVVLGMSAIPAQVKVMAVAGPGGYEYIPPQDRTHIVSAWAASGFSATLVLVYFKDKLNVRRIGILTTADTIGQKIAEEFASAAKLAGIEVARVVSQPVSDRDAAVAAPASKSESEDRRNCYVWQRTVRHNRCQPDRTRRFLCSNRLCGWQHHSRVDQGYRSICRQAVFYRFSASCYARHVTEERSLLGSNSEIRGQLFCQV